MIPFADTNWLEATYIKPAPEDAGGNRRHSVAKKRNEKETKGLLTSHIVLLEARNVFGRRTKEAIPDEWNKLYADFNGKIFVDPMDWDLLRQESNRIFEQFAHKAVIGTFDAAVVASAQLAGAREILSFDESLKALAAALDLQVYPQLTEDGRSILAKLKSRD